MGLRVREEASPSIYGLRPQFKNNDFTNVHQFRGELELKAIRRLYHLTLGLRVIKKKKTAALWRLQVLNPTLLGQ